MPVTDFECQIARGQIGRYLGGGLLSTEALSGLEAHLAECPGCKTLVAERRAELLGALGGMPTHAVASVPVADENPLLAALRARSEKAKPEPKPAAAAPRYAKSEEKTKPVFGKPMALAALLAVVLVGMSYVSRATGGHGALGAKAATTFAAETLPEAAPKKVESTKQPEPAPQAKVPETKPDPAPVTTKAAVTPPVAPASTPKTAQATKPAEVAVAKPTTTPTPPAKAVAKTTTPPKPTVAKPAPTVPAATKPTATVTVKPIAPRRTYTRRRSNRSSAPKSAVRVYGLDGHPLKP